LNDFKDFGQSKQYFSEVAAKGRDQKKSLFLGEFAQENYL